MKYSQMRLMLLTLKSLHEALNVLVGEDLELRRHLESLLIVEWEKGFDTGYKQAKTEDWSNHESHV